VRAEINRLLALKFIKSGAYLGIEAIPEGWIMRIEKSAYLNDLSRRLAAKKAGL